MEISNENLHTDIGAERVKERPVLIDRWRIVYAFGERGNFHGRHRLVRDLFLASLIQPLFLIQRGSTGEGYNYIQIMKL